MTPPRPAPGVCPACLRRAIAPGRARCFECVDEEMARMTARNRDLARQDEERKSVRDQVWGIPGDPREED